MIVHNSKITERKSSTEWTGNENLWKYSTRIEIYTPSEPSNKGSMIINTNTIAFARSVYRSVVVIWSTPVRGLPVIFFVFIMATLFPFGTWELNDSFLRAVDFEEEDEDQIDDSNSNKEDDEVFSFKVEEKVKYDVLLLATGMAANAFADLLYCENNDKKLIASVISKHNLKETQTSDSAQFTFHSIGSSKILIGQCKRTLRESTLFSVTKQIFSLFNVTKVIVLTSMTSSSNGTTGADNDNLRIMTTKTWPNRDTCKIQYLDKMAMVSGLAAAILAHCEVMTIPALLCTLIDQSWTIDHSSIKSFFPILEEDSLLATEVNQHDLSKRLSNLKLKPAGHAMYI